MTGGLDGVELPDIKGLVDRIKWLGESPEVQDIMVGMAQDAAVVATLALTNPRAADRAAAQLKAQAALLGSAQAEVFAREWQSWATDTIGTVIRHALAVALG